MRPPRSKNVAYECTLTGFSWNVQVETLFLSKMDVDTLRLVSEGQEAQQQLFKRLKMKLGPEALATDAVRKNELGWDLWSL